MSSFSLLRTLIYAIHLCAIGFLFFAKAPQQKIAAKLTFITPRPVVEERILTSPKTSSSKPQSSQQTSSAKKPPPKAKDTKKTSSTKPTPTKPVEKKQVKMTSPSEKGKTQNKLPEQVESLQKIESLLHELQQAQPKVVNQTAVKKPTEKKPLFAENYSFVDSQSLSSVLFSELQLPYSGEVELEIEIENEKLRVARIVRSENDNNLSYLLKRIPEIELADCKKIAGLENGLRLRITFCTKPN